MQDIAIDYLLEVFKVDVAKLVSGGTVWAKTARVWIEKIENGAFVLCVDGEGQNGKYYEVGAAKMTAEGAIEPLMNLLNRGEEKIDTGVNGRRRYQYPPLTSNQGDALAEHVAMLIAESAAEDVLAFRYGGAEDKWFREMGIPNENFGDALQFLRYCLGCKLNGHWPDACPYGDQMSTARARADHVSVEARPRFVPFAGPLLLHLYFVRVHPDAHRPRGLRVHDQARPRDGRRPGAPPRRQEQEDARHVQGAQLGVGARRQGGAAGARDLPRQRQLEEVVAAIALDVDLILFCNPWRARCCSSRAPYSLRAFLGSAGR